MDVYIDEIIVEKEDLDALNHVNNVRYVNWIQEIAKAHWLKKSTKEMNRLYFWVITSHHINYKRSAFLNDRLLLKTFVEKSEGSISTRIVEMYNSKTNKLIVKSKTEWCLMSVKTKKPSKI